MYRIDSDGSVASLPGPSSLGTEGFWSKGNPLAGQAATVEDQDWFNMVQEGLIAFLTAAGMSHTKSDYSRLWQSLGRSVTFPDVGTTNAVVVSLPAGLAFPLGSVGLGTVVRVKLANSFTGAATFAPFGLAATPILRSDGTPAGNGDGVAGSIAEFVNDGAGHWQLLAGGKATLITAVSPVIYVRTDGNDANDGSANTAGSAVATLARAYQIASRYYVPGGVVTVQLGNIGSYASSLIPAMAAPLVIRGDFTGPQNYIIHGAGANNISAASGSGNNNVTLIGVTINNDDSTNNMIVAGAGGTISLSFVRLSATGISNTAAMIAAFPGGSITLAQSVTCISNCGILLAADGGAVTLQAGGSLFALGGPAFSNCTVRADDAGVVQLVGSIIGAANGVRYRVSSNGVIDGHGGGASLIFGDTPGVNDGTGGQYV